jgi:glyoxylase-like metal-dependent hydrolase (beta-lactamase superfamily II)
MDTLWGTLEPIPADKLKITEDGASIPVGKAVIRVLETPGHAIHHNAYFLDGKVFTGDVGGVAIGNGPNLPPTPPPDIDLPTWTKSIDRIKAAKPDGFFPTHFGLHRDPAARFDEMLDELHEWAAFVKERLLEGRDEAGIVPLFEAWLTERLLKAGVGPEALEAYRTALPFAMNVTGLVRYWKTAGKAA